MTEPTLTAHAARLVHACKAHLDAQEKSRRTALEYYDGTMSDLPAGVGHSSVTSNDVRATIKKVMPSILRAILGGDTVVTYEPVGPEDEASAAQATDYVNHVVVPTCGAIEAIHDAIHDACLVKTGILKWCAYETREAKVHSLTGQPDEALLGLQGEPGIEVMDLESEPETDPLVLQMNPAAMRHSFKVKHVSTRKDVRLEAVPRGSFLITPGAEEIETAELVGEEQIVTRSQLVAWGYDKDAVWRLAAWSDTDKPDEEARKGEDYSTDKAASSEALEEVLIWEIYLRHDEDEDGIAEIHRLVFGEGEAGGGDARADHVLLGQEVVAEAPYAAVVIERDPYQFEGRSIYEDVRDVQRVKTAVMRGILDNIYRTNAPRPAIDMGAVQHPEDVTEWIGGKPIRLKPGTNIGQALQWASVPSIVANAFPVLEYMDEVARDRTGITDASGGIDADQLANTSATAATIMSEAGVAQADAIVRSVARCLRKAFRGLLKLVIAHADQPRTLRLKGEWVQYDARVWNTEMDCTVNTGLGGGTKERDLAILQVVLQLQEKIMMSLGPQNPLVTPVQVYNTLAKITEAAGFANPDRFFTEPDPQAVQAMLQQAASKPDPEQMKLQGQMQVEQAKLQANVAKEQAQMQADLTVKRAEIDAEDRRFAQTLVLEREKLAQQERLALQKLAVDRESAMRQAEAAAHRPAFGAA